MINFVTFWGLRIIWLEQVMLRNRSRAVTSKQALMADHSSQSSPTQKNYTKAPSFFGSPRFRAFTIKGHSETDSLISPTSILDSKPFPFATPFSYDQNQPKTPKVVSANKSSWHQPEPKGIGLALLETLNDEKLEDNASKPNSGKVLFGTKLRVQIPPFPASALSPTQSPKSPADFKIETPNSQSSAIGSANSGIQTEHSNSAQATTGCASVSEMELSEDYTCVISRGPNPRTTHIFDNCIVESFYSLSDQSSSASVSFLSFCYTCKKNLEQKNDIYIYRGEKAFCSRECRYQEMLLDEVGNSEFDDAIRTCS